MFILSKIWSLLKSFWAALCEEPANNVLGQELPPDEEPTDKTDQS